MDSDDVIRFVCQMLNDGVAHFNWVGVYRCRPEDNMLELGPYSGEETEHTEIPYGKGVCGPGGRKRATADRIGRFGRRQLYFVQLGGQSEAVVPVVHGGRVLAVLDVDSFGRDAFSKEDVELLEGVAEEIIPFI